MRVFRVEHTQSCKGVSAYHILSPYILGTQSSGFGQNNTQQDPFANYRAFTYGDTNLQNAMDWLDTRAKNSLYYTDFLGGTTSLNTGAIDPNLRQYISGKDGVGVGYGDGTGALDGVGVGVIEGSIPPFS